MTNESPLSAVKLFLLFKGVAIVFWYYRKEKILHCWCCIYVMTIILLPPSPPSFLLREASRSSPAARHPEFSAICVRWLWDRWYCGGCWCNDSTHVRKWQYFTFAVSLFWQNGATFFFWRKLGTEFGGFLWISNYLYIQPYLNTRSVRNIQVLL